MLERAKLANAGLNSQNSEQGIETSSVASFCATVRRLNSQNSEQGIETIETALHIMQEARSEQPEFRIGN